MAKIALIVGRVDSTVEFLARSLSEQQHDVLLIAGEIPSSLQFNKVEVWQYSSKALQFSLLKLIPQLLFWRPEIIHFIEGEVSLPPLLPLVTQLKLFSKNSLFAYSVLTELRLQHPLHRMLLQSADLVTTSTLEDLGLLRGLKLSVKQQGRAVLSPLLDLDKTSEYSAQSAVDKFIVVPLRAALEQGLNESCLPLLLQKSDVLFCGDDLNTISSRQRKAFEYQLQENCLITTTTHCWKYSEKLKNRSQCLWLAGFKLNRQELKRYMQQALCTKTVLVLDHQQSHLHPQIWKHGENCWILNPLQLQQEAEKLLQKTADEFVLDYDLSKIEQTHKDLPMNELSRLYQKALEYRQDSMSEAKSL